MVNCWISVHSGAVNCWTSVRSGAVTCWTSCESTKGCSTKRVDRLVVNKKGSTEVCSTTGDRQNCCQQEGSQQRGVQQSGSTYGLSTLD